VSENCPALLVRVRDSRVGNYEAALPLPSSAAYVGELKLILALEALVAISHLLGRPSMPWMGFAVLGNHRSARPRQVLVPTCSASV
jgi:hypothetical protein